MIEAIDLTKRYGEKTAVDNLNLKINDGELFSLLGVNGAGKTTTIKMMTTLIKPTNGMVKILGYRSIDEKGMIRKNINVSPQETAIAPNLTVLENLEFMAGVYQIKDVQKRINELVEAFKLTDVLKQKAKTLSGGYQRRLSIAISLINDPKVLFLDEPTLGLDVIARSELWDIIKELKGKKTIVLTTHYMEEAEALSDRIGIIKDGKLIEIGTPKELIKKAKAKNIEDAFIKIVRGDK